MVDTQKVGAFIAQCRKEHNWTQKELGEKLGVTDKAVSKWENGRSFPDITLLESLCETFDITVSELLSGKKIESEDYKRETERLLIQCIAMNSSIIGTCHRYSSISTRCRARMRTRVTATLIAVTRMDKEAHLWG